MRWSTALKWAIPVWIAVCAGLVAINLVAAAEKQAMVIDQVLVLVAAYPLTAFIIKATAADWAAWRDAYRSRRDEEHRR